MGRYRNRENVDARKYIIAIVLFSVIALSVGFLVGETLGWKQCVTFGLHFVNTDNIIDKELVIKAMTQYKNSVAGWAFDPESPYYVAK